MTNKAFERLSEEDRGALRKRKQPRWTQPMLATLHDEVFSDPEWIYERKLDGERCLAFRHKNSVRLVSRNRKELNDTYPEIVEALETQRGAFIADGEIVAFKGNRTSFERLQERMQIADPGEARRSDVAVYYYLFDLLHCGGCDLTRVSLEGRKTLLRAAMDFEDPIRLTTHQNEHGEHYYRTACRKGWEGLIAKERTSRYIHSRSPKWLKLKCSNRQEFVIGGFTEPQGERKGFGALLVGFHKNGRLQYAGKVGTGYDDETLSRLAGQLRSARRKTPPFDESKLPEKGVHWVTPKLVCDVAFTEWTDEQRLRHPRFKGLRHDKAPDDVVREER